MQYTEENGVYQIDCSKAVWSTNMIHASFSRDTSSFLSDVDFAIETDDKLILVEYKNANIPNASKPQALSLTDQKLALKLCRKFYDSIFYIRGIGKTQPCSYVCVIEAKKDDSVLRKFLRNELKKRLPFSLQANPEFIEKWVNSVAVLNLQEWNSHSCYGKFPFILIKNS